MRAFLALALLLVPIGAFAQAPAGPPSPALTATVEYAGQKQGGEGAAISVTIKNTGDKPVRIVPIEYSHLSPILIFANANAVHGTLVGVETCPLTQEQCLAKRGHQWTVLNPGEDTLFAKTFTTRYHPGRAALTISVVQELDGKLSIVPLQLRGITLP